MYLRIIAITLVALMVGFLPTAVHAQDACPDVGATGPGVERIEGQGNWTFYGVPIIVDQPVLALVDGTYSVQGLENQYPSSEGQVIGRLNSDFFSPPFDYTINLPINPTGLSLDVDQDGEEDSGLQISYVMLGQNILNTPFLEGFSQGP